MEEWSNCTPVVITSYSIHYTKLYDKEQEFRRAEENAARARTATDDAERQLARAVDEYLMGFSELPR